MNEERFNSWTDVPNMKDHIRILEQRVDFMREKLKLLDEQEPVAWHEPNAYGNVTTHKKWAQENGWQPLYTSPPQRQPLYPREIKDVLRATGYVTNSQAWELAEDVMKLLAAHGITGEQT